ncbi:MAG: hypothetical protein R2771_16035 [Saprospiraceae bacterium]
MALTGFDAHKSDMMLDLRISIDTYYYKIGKILSENFKNIFAVLEGGYNPKIIYEGKEFYCWNKW